MVLDTVLDELNAEIEALESDLRKAKDMRDWWVSRHPPVGERAATPRRVRQKKLPDYVREVLGDGRALLSSEIVTEAQALGWSTPSPRPDQLVRNCLRDMGDKVQVDDRRYSLVPATTGDIADTFSDIGEPGREVSVH